MLSFTSVYKYIITTILFLIIFMMVSQPSYASYEFISNNYPFDLPIMPTTQFYLTATPKNHSIDGNRSAIDFQIIDDMGFIDKGAPLYAPIDGTAEYILSPNESGVVEITSFNNEWKIVIAHLENETNTSKSIINTYPKHVRKGELIGYQGDSGYINGGKFPVHVHFEVFKNINGEFSNDNSVIDICSQINLKEHCNYIDNSGYVIFIKDK